MHLQVELKLMVRTNINMLGLRLQFQDGLSCCVLPSLIRARPDRISQLNSAEESSLRHAKMVEFSAEMLEWIKHGFRLIINSSCFGDVQEGCRQQQWHAVDQAQESEAH